VSEPANERRGVEVLHDGDAKFVHDKDVYAKEL
jgi:hypothetical protein